MKFRGRLSYVQLTPSKRATSGIVSLYYVNPILAVV